MTERQQDYGIQRHNGNGQILRGSGIHHPEEEEPDEEHSDLFLLAVELARVDWARIKAEKGD